MFDEFSDEYDEFIAGFEIVLRVLELLFKVSYKIPYHDMARRVLYMTNEFNPLFPEKEVPPDD